MKKDKSIEERLQELEEFQYRIKLGQKWFLCGLAAVGSLIATISYILPGISNWNLLHK